MSLIEQGAEDLAAGRRILDEDRILLPLRQAAVWVNHGLPPADLFDQPYRLAVLTLHARALMVGEQPDPMSNDEPEEDE